jgi:hypothetical protein
MEDIFNIISAYLPAGYIIICLGLIVIGEMLKRFTVLPNQLLTTTLPILGAFTTAISYASSTEAFEIASLIQQICIGLLLGWASTGGFEWFKNTFVNKSTVSKVISEVEKIVEQLPEEEQTEDNSEEQTENNSTEENEG